MVISRPSGLCMDAVASPPAVRYVTTVHQANSSCFTSEEPTAAATSSAVIPIRRGPNPVAVAASVIGGDVAEVAVSAAADVAVLDVPDVASLLVLVLVLVLV